MLTVFIRIVKFAFVVALAVGCKPTYPITPMDSFNKIKQIYATEDVEMLHQHLSADSIKRIQEGILLESRLEEKPKRATQIVKRDELMYLKGYFRTDDGILAKLKVLKEKPDRMVALENGRARIYLKSGYIFDFVKEGPYWKYILP